MKNLLKLPVLLLAVMLVASCGDSKKEEEEKKLSPVEQAAADAKKLAELECDVEIARLEDDSDKVEKLEEQREKMNEEMEQKWGDEEDDKIRDAAMKAYDNVLENCKEKIAEAEEKARQETISEVTAVAEKIAELQCDLQIARLEDDYDEVDKLEEQIKKMGEEIQQEWADILAADSEVEKAATAAYEKVLENCNS